MIIFDKQTSITGYNLQALITTSYLTNVHTCKQNTKVLEMKRKTLHMKNNE